MEKLDYSHIRTNEQINRAKRLLRLQKKKEQEEAKN